jgi:flagellar hook-associated protein 2
VTVGTVGLSFGSATSGQGFDVATTVTQIQASEQAIETPWQNQLTTLKAQDTVLSSLGTDLSTLTTSLQALTDFDGVFSEKQGSSSDTNVLTLSSATSTAISGSHTIVVNSLATTSSDVSSTVASASDTLSGTLTIQGKTFTVDSSDNTLTTLSAAINAADIGVNANVITDSSGSRLSLVSATSGAAGQLSVTGTVSDTTAGSATAGATVSFSNVQQGADASLVVDGVPITSASNTVSNAIAGVTFVLTAPSAAGTDVQVEITNDNTDIETAMNSFVTAYNAVVGDINKQEGNDSSGNPEPLYGSPVLSQLQSSLSTALFSGAASGSINNITQLGLTVNDDGTLTLDTDTLDSVLNSNFSDVTGFLQNANSFGQTISSALNTLGTEAPNGAIYLAQQQNSAQESALNTDITNENTLLATQKTTLTNELNTANQILQSIPSQLNEVNEIYSATTGFNESTE